MIRGQARPISIGTALAAAALLLWWWWNDPAPTGPGSSAVSGLAADRSVTGGAKPARPLPVPVFTGAVSPIDDGTPAAPEMSEGLATDLKQMDATQLRAELQSIAVSYPEVRLGAVACAGLPCTAEASGGDPGQLTAFAQMVSHRFQGHLRVRWQNGPGGATRAVVFQIGTRERLPPEAAGLPVDAR